ncbi:FYDLN acid domain-containing protein [Thalassospira sp. TSL5-1]|uniref:FYDLN acid domain-containing protein n=1 Tax=Thalassospira sp. TSL5-1 TaxID=1544451 RepID=UPI00093CF50B|nr:FYDLN acid domain-containing protein [Thalassospira sp. TSL5-1]OKH86646.1 hypothetical protein LF95_22085 [Thalassospira sp. TSL5-1]
MSARGKKRHCLACGTKYYDLNRTPVVCPKCGTPDGMAKPKRVAAAKPKKQDDDIDDVSDLDDDVDTDIDDDLLEDASDLGEDDDDLGEVLEHVENDDDDR